MLADMNFADDSSAISHTLAGIQEITNNIDIFGSKIGLRINCEKTKSMVVARWRGDWLNLNLGL